jgi:hypothetical protein
MAGLHTRVIVAVSAYQICVLLSTNSWLIDAIAYLPIQAFSNIHTVGLK